MSDEMMSASQMAQISHERDILFRQCVNVAIAETMKHFDFIQADVDRRDIEHAAGIAAMTALRTAIDGDKMLKSMEFERDAAKNMAMEMAKVTPGYRVLEPIDTPTK